MNNIIEYALPDWVAIAFLCVIPLPFILILLLIKKESTKLQMPQVFKGVFVFLLLYVVYISIGSYLGWFQKVFMPPKVLLFTTFPYAFFLFGYVLKTNTYQKFLFSINLHNLIGLHIFRVVGVFFLILYFYDALPKYFALIAGLGDVVAALASIGVAKMLSQNKTHAMKWAKAWNLFGSVDIIFTAVAANVLTFLSIKTGSMGVDTLALFPYCLIPAFAPPTILFLHWSIHLKIKKIKNF
jgi:hypothetical protein